MSDLTKCVGCGKLVHWCEPCNACGYVLKKDKKEIKILDPKNKDERILILEKDNKFLRDISIDFQQQYSHSLKVIKEYEAEQDETLIVIKKVLELEYSDMCRAAVISLEQLIKKIEKNK